MTFAHKSGTMGLHFTATSWELHYNIEGTSDIGAIIFDSAQEAMSLFLLL